MSEVNTEGFAWSESTNGSSSFSNNETFEMNTSTILTLPAMSDLAQVWYFYPLRWIQSIGAILGNSLVIAAILRFEHLRTPTGSLMANLAVADLLSACLMPLTTTLEYMAHTTIWLYICILKSSLYVIMAYGNVLGLAMISIDRLICLTKPFWYRKYVTLNLVLCCQGVMWVATIVACVMVYVFRSIGTVEIPSCFFVYLLSERDINFLLVYTYYFLTVIVICNYVALAGLVWKQSRTIVDCTASVNAIIQSRHRKLTKVTGLVLVCYLSFTLPAAITTSLVKNKKTWFPMHLHYLGLLLWPMNSVINPFIYAYRMPKFHAAFWKLLGLKPIAVAPTNTVPTPPFVLSHHTG